MSGSPSSLVAGGAALGATVAGGVSIGGCAGSGMETEGGDWEDWEDEAEGMRARELCRCCCCKDCCCCCWSVGCWRCETKRRGMEGEEGANE